MLLMLLTRRPEPRTLNYHTNRRYRPSRDCVLAERIFDAWVLLACADGHFFEVSDQWCLEDFVDLSEI